MHTLDAIDSALQWETERQNRLVQQALEQKKKQAGDERRSAAQVAAEPGLHVAASVKGVPDKVSRIPDMRSALIPFDAAPEDAEWSKPFALTKADLEPWTSFLAGYYQSRLFLQPPTGAAANVRDPARVDHAVRALLTLKQAPLSIVLEPPVQINRQVEYHDLEAEMRAGEGRLHVDTVLKLALDLHQKQLGKAVEKGREFGDALYEAMMGEGYCNLIVAWERVHGRKPSIDELHIMLSTGKVKIVVRAVPDPVQVAVEETPTPRPPHVPAPMRLGKPAVQTLPETGSGYDEDDEDHVTVSLGVAAVPAGARAKAARRAQAKQEHKSRIRRPIYWYLLHAGASAASAAAVAYLWLF